MAFTIENLDLSMRDPETGNIVTANIYRVPGIERDLSMQQLVMAICLQKAADLEAEIVEIMNNMSTTTTTIENLSTLESKLVVIDAASVSPTFGGISWMSDLPKEPSGYDTIEKKWTDWAKSPSIGVKEGTDRASWISNIETRLDALNTTSQKSMIELQSKTNKRDQAYDLITAMVKSIGTSTNAIASNMR